jgi:hypothetical protein
MHVALGKATITPNARNDGFGKQAVSPPCSDYYPCPTTSHCLPMSADFSRTVPWAPFTTRRFRNSAPGSGWMPRISLYGADYPILRVRISFSTSPIMFVYRLRCWS